MTFSTATPGRTSSSDVIPVLEALDPKPAFTLTRRTVSGLDLEISALVKELEALGVDITHRDRRSP